jgi:drug/metabolite transporter (DMT)-like permease
VLALALALSSSLCWGISDFLGGLQARRLPLLQVMVISQSIGLACVLIVMAVRGRAPPEFARLLPAAAGGLAGVAALTAFYRALAIGTMSIVAPIAATGVVVPVVVGIADGEHPAVLQLAGIVAATVGVILASREPGPRGRGRGAVSASVALALVAAAGFGSFAVGLRSSARADVLWSLVAARATGVVAIVIAFSVVHYAGQARRPLRPLGGPRGLAPLVAMGTLDLSANGLYALATTHGLLSVVAVAASLYPLVTVLLARTLLRERVHRIQELGIATAVAGVVMMAAG